MIGFLGGLIVGFIITALWQYYVIKKQRAIYGIIFRGLVSDANKLAQKLGHSDLIEYYIADKGSQYALNAANNINTTLKDFFHENLDDLNSWGSK